MPTPTIMRRKEGASLIPQCKTKPRITTTAIMPKAAIPSGPQWLLIWAAVRSISSNRAIINEFSRLTSARNPIREKNRENAQSHKQTTARLDRRAITRSGKRSTFVGWSTRIVDFREIVDRLQSSSAKGHTQSENREFVARRPDESVRPENRIPIRVGQHCASNDDFSFKSATKLGPQMVYALDEKSTI